MIWAILGLVFVGSSWTIVGIVMGSAPKKGLSPEIVQFFGSLIPIALGGIFLHLGTFGEINWSGAAAHKAILFYGLSAFFNFWLMQLMSFAMQRGPNGIIWSITQAGMLITFLYGVLFQDDVVTWVRILGLVVLLLALLLLGLARDNTYDGKNRTWIWMAFGCFLLCGTNQSLAMVPTYDEAIRSEFHSVARSVVICCTTVMLATGRNVMRNKGAFFTKLRECVGNKYLWIFVGAQQFFNLIASYFITYRCIDYLSAHQIGSAAYPILVASCLTGFALYSIFGLKEKTSFIQKLGMLFCVVGIILICIK
ncbi:MAG: hypothetical protein IJZ19_08460 [Lentisphaeria bacterium]|nr:hypothetical protein [Lentisphaeria bacterium]